jgi:60 kDa SS-A/Ro ribonucleoprotein
MQETGDLFAASLFKKNLSDVLIFGSTAGIVTSALNPDDSVASLTTNIARRNFGHSTNFNAIFDAAQKKYDTVVIFSDMQAWVRGGYGGWSSLGQDAVDRYKKRTGANPDIFAFDLAGMGTTQFIGPKSFQLAGFSANTLKVMDNMRTDQEAFIKEIEAVTF